MDQIIWRTSLTVNKNKQVLAKAGGCLEINVPNIRDGWSGDLELRFELELGGTGWEVGGATGHHHLIFTTVKQQRNSASWRAEELLRNVIYLLPSLASPLSYWVI